MDLQDAKVVVTGGTGFLGRHVCDELAKAGAKVEPVGRARYDLRHRAEIDRMLADTHPDAVVHLAAVVGGSAPTAPIPASSFTRTPSWAWSCWKPAGSPA